MAMKNIRGSRYLEDSEDEDLDVGASVVAASEAVDGLGSPPLERERAFKKGDLLHEGKAKRVYTVVGCEDLVWVDFKDSLTAFNAKKASSFDGKGAINRQITSFIFAYLREKSIANHWIQNVGVCEMICQRVGVIPLEVVVRNRLAGSTSRKFRREEGSPLKKPLVEFYYKDDRLEDPFVSDEQALMLQVVRHPSHLQMLKDRALEINIHLKDLFWKLGIELIDFKLEFGFKEEMSGEGDIVLADEISPDSCRLWDIKTGKKLDKDRFRHDLGGVKESYLDILNRFQAEFPLAERGENGESSGRHGGNGGRES